MSNVVLVWILGRVAEILVGGLAIILWGYSAFLGFEWAGYTIYCTTAVLSVITFQLWSGYFITSFFLTRRMLHEGALRSSIAFVALFAGSFIFFNIIGGPLAAEAFIALSVLGALVIFASNYVVFIVVQSGKRGR